MLARSDPPVHLTYCLNIHPGEDWPQGLEAIDAYARRVRDRVAPNEPFGLGLRLSARAARELRRPARLEAFADYLRREHLYVFTVNGFPYGAFHGQAVKADVYRPDWRTPQRIEYTLDLAEILAALLPDGIDGSISTVPGSYADWIGTDPDVLCMAENLATVARRLDELRRRTGRVVRLALEPEPDCYLETTDDLLAFFAGPLSRFDAPLDEHVGVCVDTAHLGVGFEDPTRALRRYRQAGVAVAKIQLSAALACQPTHAARERLEAFREPVYLHQVKARRPGGRVVSYRDLDDALALGGADEEQWRVHFHVPLFYPGDDTLRSTAGELTGRFAQEAVETTAHLEIETYTFDVLPDDLRADDVVDNIVGEYRWVLDHLLTTAD